MPARPTIEHNNNNTTMKQTIKITTPNREVIANALFHSKTRDELLALAKQIGAKCDYIKAAIAANVCDAICDHGGKADITITYNQPTSRQKTNGSSGTTQSKRPLARAVKGS